MLYFEDFMEAIENLPIELKEHLNHVKQLDSNIHSDLDAVDNFKNSYFESCRIGKFTEYDKEMEKVKILNAYNDILKAAGQKTSIVRGIYDMLVKKLDGELEKFRLELEADNSGITQQIEQKMSAMFGRASPAQQHKFEKRKIKTNRIPFQQSAITALGNKRKLNAIRNIQNSARTFSQLRTNVFQNKKASDYSRRHNNVSSFNSLPRNIGSDYSYQANDQLYGGEASTRRFSSNTGGQFDASSGSSINSGVIDSPYLYNSSSNKNRAPRSQKRSRAVKSFDDFTVKSLEGDDRDPDEMVIAGILDMESELAQIPNRNSSVRTNYQNELVNRNFYNNSAEQSPLGNSAHSGRYQSDYSSNMRDTFAMLGGPEESGETVDDEDQRKYCICRDVSYGEMIACDSASCPIEWFHYQCVGLTIAPRGEWLCPQCRVHASLPSQPKKRRR